MTASQQAALEALIGRSLTTADAAAIEPLLDPNNRNDVAIAAWVNAARPAVKVSLRVEEVFDVLFASGDYVTLKTASLAGDPRAVMAFETLRDARQIGSGTVNLQLPPTAALLDQLQSEPPLLSDVGRTALVAAATQAAPAIDIDAVSRALNLAEGRMVL